MIYFKQGRRGEKKCKAALDGSEQCCLFQIYEQTQFKLSLMSSMYNSFLILRVFHNQNTCSLCSFQRWFTLFARGSVWSFQWQYSSLFKWIIYNIRATSWQNQHNDCAPSKDSGQPGHQPSLIRVFAVRWMGSWGSSLSSCRQGWLIRLGGCLGWSESSLGAQSFCWFCLEAAHNPVEEVGF